MSDAATALADLSRIRDEIGELDQELVGLIARRVVLARRIGALKRVAGLPTLDPPREAAVVRRAGALAREAGLDDEDTRYVFWQLIAMSRRAQLEEG
jgi:chorismate mutase